VVEWWSGGVVEWWSGGVVEWWSARVRPRPRLESLRAYHAQGSIIVTSTIRRKADKQKEEKRSLLGRRVAPEGRHRLNEMLELERFLQKRNRAVSLKNAIDDLALQVIRHDDDL
jgi:hypothetical protein